MSYEAPYELPAIPRQHTLIGAGGFIESQDFVSGSSGWRIDGSGNFEGNNGNFRGDITGATGTFESALSVGSGNDIFRVDTDGDMWIGHATQGSAPFQVTKAGVLTATSGTFSGSLSVTSGTIGGWTISSSSLSLSGTGTSGGSPGTMTLKRSGISCGLWVSTTNSVADGYILINEGADIGDGIHSNLQLLAPKMASDGDGRPGMTIKNYADGDSFVDIGLDDSDPNIRLSDYGGNDKISFTGQIFFADAMEEWSSSTGYATCRRRDTDGEIVETTSSQRFKTDITTIPENKASVIDQLRPVYYKSNDDSGVISAGLIAEEAYNIWPEAVNLRPVDENDKPIKQRAGEELPSHTMVPWSINYEMLVVPLIVKVQHLEKRLAELEN